MGLELKSKRVVRALFYLVELAQVTFPAILDQRKSKGSSWGFGPSGLDLVVSSSTSYYAVCKYHGDC